MKGCARGNCTLGGIAPLRSLPGIQEEEAESEKEIDFNIKH